VPRVVGSHADACDGDGPGEHPEEIGAEGLVEVPAGDGGEEDGCELVVQGVEDVAPVNCLWDVLVLVWYSLMICGWFLVGRRVREESQGRESGRKVSGRYLPSTYSELSTLRRLTRRGRTRSF
jgi:hypothetical protein